MADEGRTQLEGNDYGHLSPGISPENLSSLGGHLRLLTSSQQFRQLPAERQATVLDGFKRDSELGRMATLRVLSWDGPGHDYSYDNMTASQPTELIPGSGLGVPKWLGTGMLAGAKEGAAQAVEMAPQMAATAVPGIGPL